MTTSGSKPNSRKTAFTLVELAIALVIIGLLVGGVLVGQDLIRAAALNQTVSGFAKYNTAIQSFYGKYQGLPGDFAMASDFGIHARGSTANVCEVDSATGETGGNDDGELDAWDGSTNGSYNGEIANFWMHLSNAGMVEGQYIIPDATDCTSAPASYGMVAGLTNPKAGVGGGLIALTDATDPPRKNLYFVLGLEENRATAQIGQAGGESIDQSPQLSPYQAGMIDEKLDDGKPASGFVKAVKHWESWGGSTPAFVLDDVDSATGCIEGGIYNSDYEVNDCVISVRH